MEEAPRVTLDVKILLLLLLLLLLWSWRGRSTLLKTSWTSPARIRAMLSMSRRMLKLLSSRAIRIQLLSIARWPSNSRVSCMLGVTEREERIWATDTPERRLVSEEEAVWDSAYSRNS